jgi:hypothetical protein
METVFVPLTLAGDSTVVVALAVLLPVLGSLVEDVAEDCAVSGPVVFGAVTVIASVALEPLPRLAKFHTPVAGL